MSTFPGPVIDAHFFGGNCQRKHRRSDETYNGMPTATDPQIAPQACSSLTTQGSAHMTESLLQLESALGRGTSECREGLGKNLASTGVLLTAEATDLEHQMHRASTIGQIMDRAAVSAVYSRRDCPACGTCCGWRSGIPGERHLVGNGDLPNLQVLLEKFWKGGHRVQLGERKWKKCST